MRIVMMGTGSFAEPTFAAFLDSPHAVVGLFAQPNRPTGKERGSTRQARRGLQELAAERGIAVHQPESVNTRAGIAAVQALQADLLVVAAYGQILSNEVLASTTHGGINVHASLLPKYRGAAPINWAIYHGETQSGVTIIRMSVRLDAGDMLAQTAVDILPDETAGALEARLAPLGARLAIDVVDRIAAGAAVPGLKQDPSQVTKAPKLTKEHGQIDWTRPTQSIANHVRAMQPWPTAYTFLPQPAHPALRLILLKAHVATDAAGPDRPPPGSVRADAVGGRLLVQCGDGHWLDVLELQPAGKRRMSAAEFLRGHALPPEARLGGADATA